MGKIFRLNVTVSYFEGTNINRYRKPILDIFKSFAWLYHLDYAISINHDFGLESGEADLVYLRSTDKTEISKKELDKVIYDVFRYGPSLLWEGTAEQSSIQTSDASSLPTTTIAQAASLSIFTDPARQSDIFCRTSLSVTTINSHGRIAFPDAESIPA